MLTNDQLNIVREALKNYRVWMEAASKLPPSFSVAEFDATYSGPLREVS